MKKSRANLLGRSTFAIMGLGLTACAAVLGGDSGDLDPPPAVDAGTPATAKTNAALTTESGEDTRFRWNRDVVVDKNENLTWQRSAPSDRMSWEDARSYCAELGVAGGHWRLPTKAELVEIVALDEEAYPFTVAAEWYWSSTRSANVRSAAWAVGVGRYTNTNTNEALSSLRCVRTTP